MLPKAPRDGLGVEGGLAFKQQREIRFKEPHPHSPHPSDLAPPYRAPYRSSEYSRATCIAQYQDEQTDNEPYNKPLSKTAISRHPILKPVPITGRLTSSRTGGIGLTRASTGTPRAIASRRGIQEKTPVIERHVQPAQRSGPDIKAYMQRGAENEGEDVELVSHCQPGTESIVDLRDADGSTNVRTPQRLALSDACPRDAHSSQAADVARQSSPLFFSHLDDASLDFRDSVPASPDPILLKTRQDVQYVDRMVGSQYHIERNSSATPDPDPVESSIKRKSSPLEIKNRVKFMKSSAGPALTTSDRRSILGPPRKMKDSKITSYNFASHQIRAGINIKQPVGAASRFAEKTSQARLPGPAVRIGGDTQRPAASLGILGGRVDGEKACQAAVTEETTPTFPFERGVSMAASHEGAAQLADEQVFDDDDGFFSQCIAEYGAIIDGSRQVVNPPEKTTREQAVAAALEAAMTGVRSIKEVIGTAYASPRPAATEAKSLTCRAEASSRSGEWTDLDSRIARCANTTEPTSDTSTQAKVSKRTGDADRLTLKDNRIHKSGRKPRKPDLEVEVEAEASEESRASDEVKKPAQSTIMDPDIPNLLVRSDGTLIIHNKNHLVVNLWRLIESTSRFDRKIETRTDRAGELVDVWSLRNVSRLELYDFLDFDTCCLLSHFVKVARLGPKSAPRVFPRVESVVISQWARYNLIDFLEHSTPSFIAQYAEHFSALADPISLCFDYNLTPSDDGQVQIYTRHLQSAWPRLRKVSVHQALDRLPFFSPELEHHVTYAEHAWPFTAKFDRVPIPDPFNGEGDQLDDIDEDVRTIASAVHYLQLNQPRAEAPIEDWFADVRRTLSTARADQAGHPLMYKIQIPKLDAEREEIFRQAKESLAADPFGTQSKIGGVWAVDNHVDKVDLSLVQMSYVEGNEGGSCVLCN